MSVTRLVTIVILVTAGLTLSAVEFAARREGSKIPTLGAMCGYVMAYHAGRMPVGRIAIYGFWWWAGWHFFAR